MLQPTRTKFRKAHKGRIHGNASRCNAMKRKGRLQVGMDADITIFDPATIRDRATFAEPAQTSTGIAHVIVNGTFVLRDGIFQQGVTPGQPVRGDRRCMPCPAVKKKPRISANL